jgi:hypothetical protein
MANVYRALLTELVETWHSDGDVQAVIDQIEQVVPTPPPDYDPRPFLEASRFTYATTRPKNPHYYQLIENAPPLAGGWRAQLLLLEWIRRTGEVEVGFGSHFFYRTVTTSDGTWRYWALAPEWHILKRRVAPEQELDFS